MALVGTGFSLEVRRLASLLPHEQTIPTHVAAVGSEMKSEGTLRDPVIVDRRTGVVLDGMHRLAALKQMGRAAVVSCSVDYSSDAIELSRWARVYDVGSRTRAGEVLGRGGFLPAESPEAAMDSLNKTKHGVAGLVEGKAFVRGEGQDLAGAFEQVRRLDESAELNRWPRTFVPEEELDIRKLPPGAIVTMVRRLQKADVLAAGESGRLFPCKTSMHSLDPRPVGVNFPIEDLDSATDATLEERLSRTKATMLPGSSVYKGRRYKERLLMLAPS